LQALGGSLEKARAIRIIDFSDVRAFSTLSILKIIKICIRENNGILGS